jgi:hypothetical protein
MAFTRQCYDIAMTVPEKENRYREPLYALLEQNRTTRAALYLMEPTGEFRLAAEYGFSPRDQPPAQFGKDHPLVERVQHHRRPFYINSPREDESLGPFMENSRTVKILVVPLYEGGRLVGILEGRDKAGGELFYQEDLKRAAAVGANLLKVRRAIHGLPDPPVPAADPIERPAPPPPAFHDGPTVPPPAAELSLPPAYALPPSHPPRPPLTQREALLFRGFAATFLLDPAIAAVVFSLWAEDSVELYVAARGPVAADAREAILSSAFGVHSRMAGSRALPRAQRYNLEFPHGQSATELTCAAIVAAQTSVIVAEEGHSLLLTLVFGREPAEAMLPAIKETHLLVRRAVTEVRDAVRYREANRGWVRTFLEPGLKRYPALVAHGLAVGKLARQFGEFLKLPESVVEQITVAGILHDVGMRELAYDRLSQRRPLTEPEYRLAREHPAVGARLLEGVEFPYAIAPIVYHHHERYDGAGYPDQLRGEQIPFGARLIHVLEAYDAMTSSTSYRATVEPATAEDIIVSKAGTQFDPDLAIRFREFRAAPKSSG